MSAAEVTPIPQDAPRGYYGPDGQPQFFQDPAMDRFVAVLVKLAQEFWVVTERLDAIERLLAAEKLVTAQEISRLLNDPQVTAQREAALATFIARTLRSLREP
jgi:hypothetical protein